MSDEAYLVIRYRKAMLDLICFNEDIFSRTVESFGKSPPYYVVEYDASLSGAGMSPTVT